MSLRQLAWVGLALVLLATAFSFPSTGAGGLGLLGLVGLAGAAAALVLRRAPPKLPGWAPDLILAALVCAVSALLFNRSWNDSGYRIYDWAAHHAILKHLVDGLRQGRIPAWVHSVSTGDSPYELYAFLPYYIAAKAALWANSSDLTLVLVRSAIVIHTLAAVGAALLSRRIVGWPWGIVVGLAILCDIGSVWGGGIEGLFAMGVTHSALAQALWSFALIVVLSWLGRPSGWKAASIWALVALSVACHPLSLVSALATLGALGLVVVFAADLSRRNALLAMLHVSLGVLLVAFVWAPFSQRLLLYGVHYGIPPESAADQFSHMLAHAVPEATASALVYVGYLGVLVAVASRRTAPTLLGAFAAILMAGLFDQLYSLLDLIPSFETARFQMVRLPSSAKPAIIICGVYLVDAAFRRVRQGWGERSSVVPFRDRDRAMLGALAGLALFASVRCILPYFDRFAQDVHWLVNREVPDQAGLQALAAWAREKNAEQRPDRYGRLWDQDERRTFLVYHVNAESGLPTLWLGPTQPLFFLRDRIEDASPESLRRFNVRWVMRADRPPSLGDPKTEQRFGRYFVRELPAWDGQFARVERGSGEVVVKRLDDERVVLDLTGTTEPALVALGTGYYPRWQASHASVGILPVYALPSFEGARLNVVAAWLPPGETTFRPSGALPSDESGRLPTAFALLAIVAYLVRRRFAELQRRLVAAYETGRTWMDRYADRLRICAVLALAIVVFTAGLLASRRPASALQIGNGLRAGAQIDVRSVDGAWRRCRYMLLSGTYRCPGNVIVEDVVASLLNDAPPSLPFNVPAIQISPAPGDRTVQVTVDAPLEGEYWASTNGDTVRLAIAGELDSTISGQQTRHDFGASTGSRSITLTAEVPARSPLQIAFVQRRRLDPERSYPRAPEHAP